MTRGMLAPLVPPVGRARLGLRLVLLAPLDLAPSAPRPVLRRAQVPVLPLGRSARVLLVPGPVVAVLLGRGSPRLGRVPVVLPVP